MMEGRQRELKPIFPQIRNANNVVNAFQPAIGGQVQKDKQIQKMEENDW